MLICFKSEGKLRIVEIKIKIAEYNKMLSNGELKAMLEDSGFKPQGAILGSVRGENNEGWNYLC